MRLLKVHIGNFRSIRDSTEFDIDDITCLVGKNESGKTALLQALYRLNPVVESAGHFDVLDDYPRHDVIDYQEAVDTGRLDPAQVVKATYELDADDIQVVKDAYGPRCFKSRTPKLVLRKGYTNDTIADIDVSDNAVLKHVINDADLPQSVVTKLRVLDSLPDMIEVLSHDDDMDQAGDVQDLINILYDFSERGVAQTIFDSVIIDRIPQYLYFDEYYQMKGQDNLNELMERVDNDRLHDADYPLVGLIEMAGLDLKDLLSVERTQALLSKLQAAETKLTQRLLVHWSQNRHLRMKLDIRPAHPDDGPGMTAGTNIWGFVHDEKRKVDTPLGTRSRGFVWFFSFLAWYSKIRKENDNLILLLDEPGLALHAKAQSDLLRYFESELTPHHQLIYSTHSPFMIDPARLDRVRIVQDLDVEDDPDQDRESEEGTKVITEILNATPDSLFPLQGALGYEIHQTLFVGPNSLVVEGVSDLLYLQVMSGLLQQKGEPGLSGKWTVTPVGGSDKVSTFVALLGSQTSMNIVVLLDFQKKDHQQIENLYKTKLLHRTKVRTYAEFVQAKEADIEDLFEPKFYLDLVNGEYGSSIELKHLKNDHPRLVRRVEHYLAKKPLPKNASFNHYRPARYLSQEFDSLVDRIDVKTLDRFRQVFKMLNDLL